MHASSFSKHLQRLAPDTCSYSLLVLALAGSLGFEDSFTFSFSVAFFSVDGDASAEELPAAADGFFA
jgi:hypothetical protein